jgi:transcriptional regulator of NAD metabolism
MEEDKDEFMENMSRSQTQVVQSQGDGLVHKEGVDGDANAEDEDSLNLNIHLQERRSAILRFGKEKLSL